MLVKLSGDKYIESNQIACIEKLGFQPEESKFEWVVRLSGQEVGMRLTGRQFDELMDCLPTPAQSLRHKESKGEAQ